MFRSPKFCSFTVLVLWEEEGKGGKGRKEGEGRERKHFSTNGALSVILEGP
jgi:hypothetical protein